MTHLKGLFAVMNAACTRCAIEDSKQMLIAFLRFVFHRNLPRIGYPVRQLQSEVHVQERSARQLLSREKRVAIDDASGTVPVHQHASHRQYAAAVEELLRSADADSQRLL